MRKWISGKYALFIFAALIFGRCAEGEGIKEKPQSPFFDIKAYFQKETERLQSEQPPVKKTVTIGGEKEEQSLDQLDYEKELIVFQDSDINRTSWWDRYDIDSTFNEGQLSAISYSALNENLKTRRVELQFSNAEVQAVFIENETNSLAVNFFQQLRYLPGKGYSIYTRQKVTLSAPEEMKIEVSFK